jgi:tRNA uridine 5-carboxymethylaminomethyl modification enzyme
MLTSRAEFRLLLRHDNADMRLTEYGYQVGLIDTNRHKTFLQKQAAISAEINRLKTLYVNPGKTINDELKARNLNEINEKLSLFDLLKRPGMTYQLVMSIAKEPRINSPEIYEQVEIEIMYEGYIKKAKKEAEKLIKEESITIPKTIDYDQLHNLALEARAKLKTIRPCTIGQASRISGITPADLSSLAVQIKSGKYNH